MLVIEFFEAVKFPYANKTKESIILQQLGCFHFRQISC